MKIGGSADVIVTEDKVPALIKAIQSLTNKRVMVGIPAEHAERPDSEVTNALIGYVLETGAPERNLPARPLLVPGVRNCQEDVAARLKKAGVSALSGNSADITTQLNACGLVAVSSVRDKMETGPFTPLADSTLRNRVSRGGGAQVGAAEELASRRAGNPPGTDLAQPLIDTGNLQNSITYVIRDNKDRH